MGLEIFQDFGQNTDPLTGAEILPLQIGLRPDPAKYRYNTLDEIATYIRSGDGTVRSVSVVTQNGISGSVANPTTTPAITLVLGDITPSSVAATGNVSGANLSGTNTGNVTIGTGNGLSLAGQVLSMALASATVFGTVKVDGTTIISTGGVLSATAQAPPVTSVNGQVGAVVLTTANINDSTNRRYVTDAQLVVIGNTSGVNTGDQIVPVNTTASTSQYFTAYNSATGAFTKAQPAFTDISGIAAAAQLPLATTGAFGAVKPDGTTVTISGGVISAVSSGGTVTVTGTPLIGQLTMFSSGTSITNGNLSGDVTTGGSLATTLATVNSNVGSFGSSTAIPNFTVNGKGLITAAGTSVVIAPAGTLSGTTLNSTVVSSSLTSVGAQAQALNMNSHLINNLTDPVSAQDAATKNYVDTVAQGLSAKASAKLATASALPSNIYNNGASGIGATITGVATGVLTIDGTAVALNDRVVVKNESTAANNGIYICTVAGAGGVAFVLTRTVDADTSAELDGAFIFVESGTVNGATGWVVANSGTITIGTTPVNFTQFSGAGTYTAGNGLVLTGSQFSIDATIVTTLTGSQVLTNKDLTSGTNTFPTFNQNTTGSAAKWTTARLLAGNSVDGSANAAFANAFIVQGTTDTGLSGAQFLGALGTGILKNTNSTGVLSIAIAADFPVLNQNTSGQAGTVATISGLITAGANVTISGSGTSGSPYSIAASGGGATSSGLAAALFMT